MDNEKIFAAVCAAVILIMLIYHLRRRKRVRSLLFGSLTGLAALFILNGYGASFDTQLPLNLFNLCGSAVLGVPFVICAVILQIL